MSKKKQGGELDILDTELSSCGARWRSKKEKKKQKGSQTPGKTKCDACQASSYHKWCASKSRAYRDENYSTFIAKARKNYG